MVNSLFKHKKLSFILVFLILFSECVFASTYTISGYRFKINGKTKEETVRDLIVSKSAEQYKSEAEVKKALEKKRQTLINSRLFFEDEIFFSYDIEPSGGDNYNVFVSFVVKDAKSSLLLPYPQYDSNTGLVLGLRYKDKNFMGSGKELSVVFDAEQNDNSFKKGEYYLEIPFEEIRLGNIDFAGDFEFNLNLDEKKENYIAFELEEKNLSFGKVSVPAHVSLDYNYQTKKFREIGYGVGINGISIGKNIRLNLSNNMLLDWETVSDTYLNAQALFRNIKIGNAILTNKTFFKLENKTKDLKDGLCKEKLENTITLGFTGNLSKWSFSNLLSYNYDYSATRGDLFKINNAVNYKISSVYTGTIGLNIQRYENGGLYLIDPYEKITIRSKVAKKIPFVLSLSEHNKYFLEDSKMDFYFSSSLSSNYGDINYVENFRKGTNYSITAQLDYHPWQEEKEDKTEYKFKIDFTSFPFALKWLNPSLRGSLVASSAAYYWKDDSGWRLDKDDIQSLFRGIRTDNDYVKKAYSKSKLIGALNFNLVSTLFVFEDFGKAYLNLFVDSGIIRADKIDEANSRDYKVLTGTGLEIVCIMDSHPSYPIRMSFGMNAESFKDKFISKKEDIKLEYEIFVGLGWLF